MIQSLELPTQRAWSSEPNWLLCFLDDRQFEYGDRLHRDLSGSTKFVRSGYAYSGIIPASAWRAACQDRGYRVMHRSLATFASRWERFAAKLAFDEPPHYVSLGVGTGEKDAAIIRQLGQMHVAAKSESFYYFAVDMSPELLRTGVDHVMQSLEKTPPDVTPVGFQVDFSRLPGLKSLARQIHGVVGDKPIFVTLLGNTISNFLHDTKILKRVADILMRPQDSLAIEVGYTDHLDEGTMIHAENEYRAAAFEEFALSSLLQFTDLPIESKFYTVKSDAEDMDGALIEGPVAGPARAIRLTMNYVDQTQDRSFRGPVRRSKITLGTNEPINLYISRRYTRPGIDHLLRRSGLTVVGDKDFIAGEDRPEMGLCLAAAIKQFGSVLLSHASEDAAFVAELRARLRRLHVSAWMCTADMREGERIAPAIAEAIHNSDCTVLVFSEDTLKSDWVKAECNETLSAGRKVIPILRASSTDLRRLKIFGPGLENLADGWADDVNPDFRPWDTWSEDQKAAESEKLAAKIRLAAPA